MKNMLGFVLLLLFGSISSGFISSASSKYAAKKYISAVTPKPVIARVFPVAGDNSMIGSFWGATRDGGKRRHEGIDIFAPKSTPVVAVTDGVVMEVGNTPRGGKTIWLKSTNDQFTYYYAHLDEHLVKTGDIVKKGQHLGTVGNTGNAKLTPPHLHFGIYSYKGAVNPLPYVKKLPKVPLPVPEENPSETVAVEND